MPTVAQAMKLCHFKIQNFLPELLKNLTVTPCRVSMNFHLQRDDSSIPMKWNYYNISYDDMTALHHHPCWCLLWSDDCRPWSLMTKLRARWWRVGIIDNNNNFCERWNVLHLEVGDGNLSKTNKRLVIQIFTWGHGILENKIIIACKTQFFS